MPRGRKSIQVQAPVRGSDTLDWSSGERLGLAIQFWVVPKVQGLGHDLERLLRAEIGRKWYLGGWGSEKMGYQTSRKIQQERRELLWSGVW